MGPADGPPLAACFKVLPTMAVRQLQRQVPPTSLIIRNRLHPGWDGDPCHQVVGGPVGFAVHLRPLSAIDSPDEQAAIDKAVVSQVVIETRSYCSRTCGFCPSTKGLRQHTQSMSIAVYGRILDDLSSIDFSGSILFQLYNEPIVHEHIYPDLEKRRDRFPKARLGLNINGDYLGSGVVDRRAGGSSPQGCAAETAASCRREHDYTGPDSLGRCRLLAQSFRGLKSRLLFAPKIRSSAGKSDLNGMKVIFSRGLVDL